MPAQAARTLHKLLRAVEADPDSPDLFPASAVGYFYYLLASILKNGGKVSVLGACRDLCVYVCAYVCVCIVVCLICVCVWG